MNAEQFEREGPQGAKLAQYEAWLKSRPEGVREVVAKFPPWRRYRIKPTDAVVGLMQFSQVTEPGEGQKKGDVVFHVKVIEIPADKPALRHFLGKIVIGVKPEQLVMVEPR